MALSGLSGAPEGCLGVRPALLREPPAQPAAPALPRPTFRGLHPSAVFPIKAGIPGWAQTKRDRGKSTPRANQTLAYFTRVRLGSQRCLLIHDMQSVPARSLPGKTKQNKKPESTPNERLSPLYSSQRPDFALLQVLSLIVH